MKKFTVIYVALFFCAFVYMAKHGVVGLDEIMLLDPGINFTHGNYSSKLWVAAGTELHFMAYLPAITVFRLPFLYLLPNNILYHRLPFVLVFILCTWLIYKITKARFKNTNLPLLTVLLFINDKGLWDATLSGRSEILQVLLILLYFFFELKNQNIFSTIIKGFIVGCLLLTHPPAWIIAITLLFFLYKKKNVRLNILATISVIFPLFLFLFSIHFKIHELASQLFMDGSLLSSQHSLYYRLTHFYSRGLPYPYLYQPWVILLFFLSLYFSASPAIFKERLIKKIVLLFVVYLIFLIFTAENYYRYNVPLLTCMYLMFPYIIKHLKEKNRFVSKPYLTGLMIFFISIPFVFRLAQVVRNREYNETETLVNQFKNDPIINQSVSTLLVGEPVGYYLALNTPLTTFSTTYSIAKFSLEKYSKVYYLSCKALPPRDFRLIQEYHSTAIEDGTYKGLKWYEAIKPSF